MNQARVSWQAQVARVVWGRMTARIGAYKSIQELRNAQAGRMLRPRVPRGMRREIVSAGGVPAEWLIPSEETSGLLLYLHGGAWTLGYYQPHRWMARVLAGAAGLRALVLDYRLAQEQLRSYIGAADPRDPLVSPYYADLRGLPPLLIQVGGAEWLREDVERFVPRAREAGVDVTLQVWPGMWHVWQMMAGWIPEADRAVAEVARFCRGRRDSEAQ